MYAICKELCFRPWLACIEARNPRMRLSVERLNCVVSFIRSFTFCLYGPFQFFGLFDPAVVTFLETQVLLFLFAHLAAHMAWLPRIVASFRA